MRTSESDSKVRRMIRLEPQLDAELHRIAEFQHHPVGLVIRDLLRKAASDFWSENSKKGGKP